MHHRFMTPVVTMVLLLGLVVSVVADEGMWTFDNLPKQYLKEKYGFEPTDEWVRHVQLSSIRFNNGGSGSLVSPDGLVMTNHHVGQDAVHKLSSAAHDYVKNGFIALRRESEIPCKDLELNQLLSITDVTKEIRAAVGDLEGAEAADALRGAVATIEKQETQRTGLRCDVEAFYGGDQFCVYRYKKYTDVRLVFSPEKAIASFGGDRDNFCYPRWCLDVAFFRVYEDGKPASTPHFFKWSKDGAQDGDLAFVSGHPGSTGRYDTASFCRFNRDYFFPKVLVLIGSVLDGLYEYAALGAEQKRQAADEVASWENSLKAYTGYLDGLKLDRVMAKIEQREVDFLAASGGKKAEVEATLGEIGDLLETYKGFAVRRLLSRLDSTLTEKALKIVQMVQQLAKPNDERLPPFRDSSLESTQLALFSAAPIYKDMEAARVKHSLQMALKHLGADDPFVKACLADRTPEDVAATLSASRLDEPGYREELVAGGLDALKASDDPVIQLALRAGPVLSDLARRRHFEFNVPYTQATKVLAEQRRQVMGRKGAPDANFTLRLSFGEVKGYELGTTDVPFTTTTWGLFERHAAMRGTHPYGLPTSWDKAKKKIALDTEFNFVCTADIIGGNSGSPVLNRKAEVIGLIFDGNIQSLSNKFVFDDKIARAVSVHSNIIIESLRSVYDAHTLADEIVGSGTLE